MQPIKSTSALGEQSEALELRRPALDAGSQGLRIKCPAKINLTLEILNKRKDGFHNIQSVMQTINLFDILTIKVEPSETFEIKLSGTSEEIPYDERNLVHKAVLLFFDASHLSPLTSHLVSIYIEKNIPISAGLAGGSTDAAGTLWGLNKLFNNILSETELHKLCAKLGSDLNFCLEGGCQLTTGRGEILEKLEFQEFNLSLIKPKNLGISAKEAYTKFSALKKKPNLNITGKWKQERETRYEKSSLFTLHSSLLHNDLELAVINDYKELQDIKKAYPNSIMSGSGSTFFVIGEEFKKLNDDFWVQNGLKSIPYGVTEYKE